MHGNVDIVSQSFTKIRIASCRLPEFGAVQRRVERTARSSTAATAATSAAGGAPNPNLNAVNPSGADFT